MEFEGTVETIDAQSTGLKIHDNRAVVDQQHVVLHEAARERNIKFRGQSRLPFSSVAVHFFYCVYFATEKSVLSSGK